MRSLYSSPLRSISSVPPLTGQRTIIKSCPFTHLSPLTVHDVGLIALWVGISYVSDILFIAPGSVALSLKKESAGAPKSQPSSGEACRSRAGAVLAKTASAGRGSASATRVSQEMLSRQLVAGHRHGPVPLRAVGLSADCAPSNRGTPNPRTRAKELREKLGIRFATPCLFVCYHRR